VFGSGSIVKIHGPVFSARGSKFLALGMASSGRKMWFDLSRGVEWVGGRGGRQSSQSVVAKTTLDPSVKVHPEIGMEGQPLCCGTRVSFWTLPRR
jgi:hypothetical protein